MHEIARLRPSDAIGGLVVAATLLATGVGIALALSPRLPVWATGQVVLAAALVEWFIVLHECGHGTMFARRGPNRWAGWIAGWFSLIPFATWRRIHQRHHKWTGWQDLDPTTAGLVPRPLGRLERATADWCWRLWIPLFAVLYRATNFWHVRRLRRLFPGVAGRRLTAWTLAHAAGYVVLVVLVGPVTMARLAGVALVLSFVAQEVLLISQHTHLPMTRSDGRGVAPYPPPAQERFTRSLRLPRLVSRLALHFDAHELHHMFPAVPGYRLQSIAYRPAHEVPAWRWIPAARRVRGSVLLFQNRDETGFDL
ncbi:MAG: fatty acid desaturase [Vicinamibacterales bacterium]